MSGNDKANKDKKKGAEYSNDVISGLFSNTNIFKNFLAILSFVFSTNFCFQVQAQTVGKSVSLSGDVILVRSGSNKIFNIGESVSVGDLVKTGKGASAKILLIDDSVIDLKENSSFKFNTVSSNEVDREADFELDFGSVRASVNKKVDRKGNFKIKTKASVFAVRGTDFNVTAENENSGKLTVFEGQVEAASDSGVSTLDPGGEYRIQQGRTSTRQLSKPELDKVFELSRVEDINVFQNIVVGDFKTSRNFGSATVKGISGLGLAPIVTIPKDTFKAQGVYKLNAAAVSPGALNSVTTTVGVKIQ